MVRKNSLPTGQTVSNKSNAAKMLAFGSAAAGGLLAAGQANADIQYSGLINGTIPAGFQAGIDVDADGDADLTLVAVGATSAANKGFAFVASTAGFFQSGGTGGGFPGVAQNVTSGGVVSAGMSNVAAGTGWMGWASAGASATDVWGAFASPGVPQQGIVAFQFDGASASGGNALLNGWMRLELEYIDVDADGTVNAGDSHSITLVDFAYNDDPTSVYNGHVGNQLFSGVAGGIHLGASVPEPGTLGMVGLLALGAIGVRRRRQSAA